MVINAKVAAQTLGFIWLAVGVVLLIVLRATGRTPDLSVMEHAEGEHA